MELASIYTAWQLYLHIYKPPETDKQGLIKITKYDVFVC